MTFIHIRLNSFDDLKWFLMRKKILIITFSTIAVTSLAVMIIIVSLSCDFVNTIFKNSWEDNITRIERQLCSYQKILSSIEKSMNSRGEKALRKLPQIFPTQASVAKASPDDLRGLAKKLGVTDLYFIDREGVVYNSSLKADLNLNLKTMSRNMKDYIEPIYNSGEICSQGIFVSITEGTINHYMYFSPPGSDTLYEISMDVSEFIKKKLDLKLYEFLYGDMFTNFYNESLQSIDLYAIAGKRKWSLINRGKKLNMQDNLSKKLISTGKLVIDNDDSILVYKKMNLKQYAVNTAGQLYVELVYDTSGLKSYYRKVIYASAASGIIIVFIMFIAVRKVINIFFLDRVSNVITGLGRIRDGDYTVYIFDDVDDEMGDVVATVNEMTATIAGRTDDLRESNDQLRELSAYIKDIIESMPTALITIDGEDRVVFWNREAENLVSVKREDAEGEVLWQVFPGFEIFKNSAYKAGSDGCTVEMRKVVLPGRGKRLNNIGIYPFSDNRIKGVVILIDDITELDRKESLLERARKLEVLGTMAGGLAHDFNNIMTGILSTSSYLEFLYKNGDDPAREDVLENLDIIKGSGKKAAGLVESLMSLPDGNMPDFKRLDLYELIEDVLSMTRNTHLQGIKVNFSSSEPKILIDGERARLEQVFLNLIVNASEAMKGDKSSVDRTPELRIFIEKNCSDDTETGNIWHILFQDSGPGIDSAFIDRIFDPLATTKEKGTGLGLAVVNNIIISHNGHIDVSSRQDCGACFDIYLPAAE